MIMAIMPTGRADEAKAQNLKDILATHKNMGWDLLTK